MFQALDAFGYVGCRPERSLSIASIACTIRVVAGYNAAGDACWAMNLTLLVKSLYQQIQPRLFGDEHRIVCIGASLHTRSDGCCISMTRNWHSC